MAVGILLVGGFGTRLKPLTDESPKPMLPVAGLPVTEHQILAAKKAGIHTLVLATSYLAEVFTPYFGDGAKWGMKILYAVEKEPLGTGGAIRNAAELLGRDEPVVIFNGDVLSRHSIADQIAFHIEKKADVTLHLIDVEDARAFGCVPTDSEGRVTAFLEKMDNPVTNSINAGCYVFSPEVIDQIPLNTVVSVEREIFPALLDENFDVFGYHDGRYWIDMGTPQSFVRASRDLVMQPEISSATVITGKGFFADHNATIDPSAVVGGGSAIAPGVKIGPKATVTGSIIGENVEIGEGAEVIDSYIAAGLKIPPSSSIQGQILAI